MNNFNPAPSADIQYYQSKMLDVRHGMFNRNHGISEPPYASLNISFGVGDDSDLVNANRQRIKEALGITYLISAKQIHGNQVVASNEDVHCDMEVEGYDALITDQEGVGLLIQQADCQAILLHDPENKVIAAIHCGWRGSVSNIIKSTIMIMEETYLVNPSQLKVAISPSLGPCCAEFVNYRSELPEEFHRFQESPNHFNFWDISVSQLHEAGVKPQHIDVAGICTFCNQDYFSYRRSNKKGKTTTGRNGSVICLS